MSLLIHYYFLAATFSYWYFIKRSDQPMITWKTRTDLIFP